MLNLKYFILVILSISFNLFYACENKPQTKMTKNTIRQEKKQRGTKESQLEKKIIDDFGFKNSDANLFDENESFLMEAYLSESDKPIKDIYAYLQKLYNILKQENINYHHYYIKVAGSFGAATLHQDHKKILLSFKYPATKEEIKSFISRYKNIYQYLSLEKKILGTNKEIGKKLGGMPIIVLRYNYSENLNRYYDWLLHLQHKKIPRLNKLIKIKNNFPEKIILWLDCSKKVRQKIILKNFTDSDSLMIEFNFKVPIKKLNSDSLIKQIKQIGQQIK